MRNQISHGFLLLYRFRFDAHRRRYRRKAVLMSKLLAISLGLVGIGASSIWITNNNTAAIISTMNNSFQGMLALIPPKIDPIQAMNPSEYGWEIVRRINVACEVWE